MQIVFVVQKLAHVISYKTNITRPVTGSVAWYDSAVINASNYV